MDAILTAVLGAAPQLGGLVGMTVLVVLLIRREAQTTERHGAELDRLIRTHDAEMAELREENAKLRGQRDAVEQQLRELWHPQDPARWGPGRHGGG